MIRITSAKNRRRKRLVTTSVGVLGVERNAERTALLAGGKEPYAARTYMRA